MSQNRINDQLVAALRELATAQVLADAETSRSYCRDIPSGHATRYATHHARAHDLQRIRTDIRALIDHPDGDLPVRPVDRALPADPAERPATLDPLSSASGDLVQPGISQPYPADAVS